MDRYLIIENDIVVNIVAGEVDGGVKAIGGLESVNIGDTVIDGLLVIEKKQPLRYDQKRILEYPDITEQLDMLYKAMMKGEISKAVDFYNSIDVVKKKYPKV